MNDQEKEQVKLGFFIINKGRLKQILLGERRMVTAEDPGKGSMPRLPDDFTIESIHNEPRQNGLLIRFESEKIKPTNIGDKLKQFFPQFQSPDTKEDDECAG